MADNDAPAAPTFQLNKFYLKDASFESPASPTVFGGQNPQSTMHFKTYSQEGES